MQPDKTPPILLFGYHSSLFTRKARLALHLLRLPTTYLTVPSMPPRRLLLRTFALPYRKIPVLCIGARDLYVDTTLITEALESRFAHRTRTLFPADERGRTRRADQRLWTRFFADAPLFRTMTGVVPPRVWRSHFGADRGQLVGHALDAGKLAAKVPRNIAQLDSWLSVLEEQVRAEEGGGGGEGRAEPPSPWLRGTARPALADLALYAQLDWGLGIAVGAGVGDLTAGAAVDGCAAPDVLRSSSFDPASPAEREAAGENARAREWLSGVWTPSRYPALWRWFHAFRAYVEALPGLEEVVDGVSDGEKEKIVVEKMRGTRSEEVGLRESMVGEAPDVWNIVSDVAGGSGHQAADDRRRTTTGGRSGALPEDGLRRATCR
ncbi:hypothetical protein MPH_00119 [Macrophomina phaseolina MS6]|uniref:GST N-terminal domain-containing protein n=1 Tax=Macrophomina phaseolina (strain MS6) TaxID=1126212 RepID=K2RJ39_MACPH|nr:hypothetical protein MPH_00119 [Macrophomina phaseolina MS6]